MPEAPIRLPYWTAERAARDSTLVAAIEARRGGRLLNLDRMLLWSEPLARSWNVFLRTLRQELSLSPSLRELAICVVARRTGADYEFGQHAPEFRKAGATMEQVAALDDPAAAAKSALFDPLQQDVIRFALASTVDVEVPGALFASLARHLSPTDLVELAAVVAGYNMVARFLVALEVPPEA
jgi:alkylhydroperoxidase family enzyme